MPKGVPITIAGSAYSRQTKAKSKKRKTATASSSRKRARLSGSGDYVYKYKGATPYADVGRHLGGKIGFGEWGGAIGHLIGRLMGSGDYKPSPMVKQNVLINSGEVPQFDSIGRANVICHREYIGDIITAGSPNTFKNQQFVINPGNSKTFPWLSSIAGNYDQYKIHGMVFEFKSTSGSSVGSTVTSLGTVILSTDYNVNALPYGNKINAENAEFAQSGKPSDSFIHGIECDVHERGQALYYVRGGPVPAGDNVKFYDFANFQIMTTGFQAANVNIGELWVSYCIEFFKPQVPDAITVGYGSTHIRATIPTGANPLGTNLLYVSGRNNVAWTPTVLTVQGKTGDKWMVTLRYSGTSGACNQPGMSPTGLVGLNWQHQPGGSVNPDFMAPESGVTATKMSVSYTVEVTSPTGEAVFTFSGGTFPTTGVVDIWISDLDPIQN